MSIHDFVIDDIKSKLRDNSKVHESGCILWTASINGRGYGDFRLYRRHWLAHRASAFIAGIIYSDDDPRLVCHKIVCKFKHCINPEHLYAGDDATNRRDTVNSGTYVNQFHGKSSCRRGHEYTEENTHVLKNGERVCRACANLRAKVNYPKRAAKIMAEKEQRKRVKL